MRLATIFDGSRDGALVVVDGAGSGFVRAGSVAPTLQAALDDWERVGPELRELSSRLSRGEIRSDPLSDARLLAPLPRAYEWIDGSSYLSHVRLVRKARGAEPPVDLEEVPLIYQGGSGVLLGAKDDLLLLDPDWGLDFEAEIAVILGDVHQGVSRAEAERAVRLLTLVNDVTYRNLVPPELEKGFGFFQSKPATAFSPFAVTPDELGGAFREGRVFLKLRSAVNGRLVGDLDAGPEMHFSFHDLLLHATRTRALTAGTLLGSGTVSNQAGAGVSCLAELRMREIIEEGAARTPFLKVGDSVRIEMLDAAGRSVFGAIEQRVVEA